MTDTVQINAQKRRIRIKKTVFAVLRYVVLTLAASAILIPFLFVLASSLKANSGNGLNSIYHVPVVLPFLYLPVCSFS